MLQISAQAMPGMFLSTATPRATLDRINSTLGGVGYFGTANDPFRDGHMQYMQSYVVPIQLAQEQVREYARAHVDKDYIRALTCEEDFFTTPPCMYMPILSYAPVYELLKQGRIDGYGIPIEAVHDDDPYGRAIENGALWYNGEHDCRTDTIVWYIGNEEIEMEEDEKMNLLVTRDEIDCMLMRRVDVTSPANKHG